MKGYIEREFSAWYILGTQMAFVFLLAHFIDDVQQ